MRNLFSYTIVAIVFASSPSWTYGHGMFTEFSDSGTVCVIGRTLIGCYGEYVDATVVDS